VFETHKRLLLFPWARHYCLD